MKKPKTKTKLEKATEKFIKKWNYFLPPDHEFDFHRQINNLLNLTKLESIKEVETAIKKLVTEEKD